ncbi:HD domain-containing protein [bacterium]|nr:HD domain-containing protein [bacterium]
MNRTRASLDNDLRERIHREESQHTRSTQGSDSLYGHLERVAGLAREIGRAEGVDAEACYLAGLFHDAGKFSGGTYHGRDIPEEELSVQVLEELGVKHCIDRDMLTEVADAIRQLYRDDPDLTPLAQVLFDADNLDKLGPLGIANYFIKTGLRGRGLSNTILYKFTVELTYARHAPLSLNTKTGRALAQSYAPYTTRFIHDLLDFLRTHHLSDFKVDEVEFEGLVLDVVAPLNCSCGGRINRRIWNVPGMKCSEIHLEHSCSQCAQTHEIRFCRPRLAGEE